MLPIEHDTSRKLVFFLKRLTIALLICVTLATAHANSDCTREVNSLRSLHMKILNNSKNEDMFHLNLVMELSGTYNVLKLWEGKRLYIRNGGFDTLGIFVKQVEDRTKLYDKTRMNNSKKMDDLIFELAKCVND